MKESAAKRAEAFLAAGKLDEARGALTDALRHDRLDPDLNERMHQVLLLKGDKARVLRHGAGYLKALTNARRAPQALVALQRLQALDSDFDPPADAVLPMARTAAKAGDFRTAMRLLRGFDRRHPSHADIPAAYFLWARITREHLKQDDRAMQILKALLERYPEAAVKDAAVKYLALVSGVVNGRTNYLIAV